MNLRAIANQATQRINPNINILWKVSNGYTTSSDGSRVPVYIERNVIGQVQAVSGEALKHIDGLNISGVMRSVYVYGDMQAVVRESQKGGDRLVFKQTPQSKEASEWKVVHVIETWPDWCQVIVVLQS